MREARLVDGSRGKHATETAGADMAGAVTPAAPPGWPGDVLPPDAPGWERSARGWLFDQCPADYRAHPVLRRYPVALAQVAVHHVEAALEGCRAALAGARSELHDALPPPALEDVLEALTAEEARLLAARRSAFLVLQALRGERYVPRL